MLTIGDVLDHVIIKQHSRADKIDKILFDNGYKTREAYMSYKAAITLKDNVYSYSYEFDDFIDIPDLTVHQINMMCRPMPHGQEAIRKFLNDEQYEALIHRKRKQTILNYIEYNDYYRELMGLPPMKISVYYNREEDREMRKYEIDESKFYYVKTPIIGADITKPVHTWSYEQKILLYSYKFPKEDLIKYPYLKHIWKGIRPTDVRDAGPFEIIWTDINRSTGKLQLLPFIDNYRMLRNYFMANYYSEYDLQRTEYYERLQCILLFMGTIANVNAANSQDKIIATNTSMEEIYSLFESYGIPKFKFSLKYLNQLADKVNNFIYRKGTDKNLIDISDLFHDINVFKYFLIKTVNEDALDDPVLDPDKAYNLFYVRTPLDADNPYPYMDDESNIIPFRDIVDNDNRWGHGSHQTINELTGELVDDPKLELDLKQQNFSWVESKYIGMDNIIRLGWVSTKIAMLYRWFIDNKDTTLNFKVYYEYSDIETSLYELMLYLQCLLFHKYKRTPSIPDNLKTYFKLYTLNTRIDMSTLQYVLHKAYRHMVGDLDSKIKKYNNEFNKRIFSQKGYKARYSELNVFMRTYLQRRLNHDKYLPYDSEILTILNKVMYIDDLDDEEARKDAYVSATNDITTTADDEKELKLIYKQYEEFLDKNIDISRIDHLGRSIHTVLDFISDKNDPAYNLYNTYTKFEMNLDIVQKLCLIRDYTYDYNDYEIINGMITALTEGEKLVDQFTYDDNGTTKHYTNLLDYLVSLNPQNVAFASRITELSADPEVHEDNFDAEIIEVLVLLRKTIFLNPERHKQTEEALEYIQRLYTDSEVMKYLDEVIDFFKSYTQDMITRGVQYILEDANNVIHVLDDLMFEAEFDEWDLGTLTLLMSHLPTETLHRIIDVIPERYTVFTSERLELYIPFLDKYKEVSSDGLHLT